ncbi:MAG: T9SS type A sorting domain-containing protein [Prolixibacteraceae bacterium]
MKKKLLLTFAFSFMLTSMMYSQIEFQNGSFEEPDDEVKYRNDGNNGWLNGNLVGWWADPTATDSGREGIKGEGAVPDGKYTGYAYNNDGTIWNLAGMVEPGKLELALYFSVQYSWAATSTDNFYVTIRFACFEGEDTVSYELVDELIQDWDADATTSAEWIDYEFDEILPETAVGKQLLIGYDITSDLAENAWFNFDNFQLEVVGTTGISRKDLDASVIYPNPSPGIFTVKGLVDDTDYEIFNLAGLRVSSGVLSSAYNSLDLTTLGKGVYMMQSRSVKGTVVNKLIID